MENSSKHANKLNRNYNLIHEYKICLSILTSHKKGNDKSDYILS